MAAGVYAKIWWATPDPDYVPALCDGSGWFKESKTACSGCGLCRPVEHPGGYVVEVYRPTGASQWDLGVNTLEEAQAFARALGAMTIDTSELCPPSWAGRPDGDEIKRGGEALLTAERRTSA